MPKTKTFRFYRVSFQSSIKMVNLNGQMDMDELFRKGLDGLGVNYLFPCFPVMHLALFRICDY